MRLPIKIFFRTNRFTRCGTVVRQKCPIYEFVVISHLLEDLQKSKKTAYFYFDTEQYINGFTIQGVFLTFFLFMCISVEGSVYSVCRYLVL